ncbi:hypothetical protein RSOLAG1IB_11678 [Rhizoctonia solani AG-1 IB]|uniref:Uncharacterized protein n=1 Tax=Thanatephorus cucumeris (strain AG1-IB / isolate 7/3/14) TaxID=1108050 RepID=A0A0B7F8M7_THACB|nr:hypothetical protein RSOLAG1IB_11678 [Rhizoctonia solani AG-1 IB]
MPRKLVCVFASEYYSVYARNLASQMVNNKTEQCVHFAQAEAPLPTSSSKPTGVRGIMSRKSSGANKALTPPPYAKVLSGAYGFLAELYQPGDEIILAAVTGHPEEWALLLGATKVLAQHLEAGTEPIRVAQDLDPAVERERDIFNDIPKEEPPNPLLGISIESTVALTYCSQRQVNEINNLLLEEFPLSVKHIFSFNWATGYENYCDTYRDAMGQILKREVSYFIEMNWHVPVVVNATMNFIRYHPRETAAWRFITHTSHRTLTSLPVPLIPETFSSAPDTPTKASPTRSNSWFARAFTKKSKRASRSRTVPMTVTAARSNTYMSGFVTTSSGTFSPTSTPPFTPSSPRSSSLSSSDLTRSSRTSIDSGSCPTLREAYIQLPGMTKHEVWTFPVFRERKDNYHLPERVVWRSSRE